MARATESKKKRSKMSNDPTRLRGTFGDLDTFERKTPTIKARQQRKENKHKGRIIENWMD